MYARRTFMARLQVCRAVGRHVLVFADVFTGQRYDRARHELVGIGAHDSHRLCGRYGRDLACLARRDKVRHTLSGLRAPVVRDARRAFPGACPRGDRRGLVRHQLGVRRRSARCNPYARAAVLERDRDSFRHCIRDLLGDQRVGRDARAAGHRAPCTILGADACIGCDCAVPLGGANRARRRADTRCTRDDSRPRVLGGLLSVGRRRDRVLGNACAQHPRLHALREDAARADAWPDPFDAAYDGRILIRWHRRNVDNGHPLRQGTVESGRSDRYLPNAGCDCRGNPDHSFVGDDQCRRKCYGAGARISESLAATHWLRDRRGAHRSC